MVTCPSTNPSICQRERKSSVGSSVSIAKQKISLMLWFEWKLNWWNHFPMNDISVCMLFCLFFFVPPTFLHVAALNFDCARLCVTWCVRFPQSFINVLCSSFCSDCLYQVLCFLVSLCSHSKQHQYGLLLVLFTSLCFDCVSLCSSSTHYQSSLPLLLLTSSQSSHLPRSAPDDFLHTTAHCFNQSLITSQIYQTSFINWPSISQLSKLLTKQLWAIPGKVLFKVSHGLEVVGAGWIKMGPSPSSTTDPCAPPVSRNCKSTNTQIQIQNAPTNTKAPIEINHHLRRTMRSKRNSLVSSELVCVCGAWLCDIQWKRNSKESNYDWCLCVIFLIL